MAELNPRLAIIGGTGLNALFGDDSQADWRQLDTPYGAPSSAIRVSALNGVDVAFLPRHGTPHHIPPHCINYRANLWALKQIGIEGVIAVNAVGGIDAEMRPGSLVIPDQLIDYSYGREHTYFDGAGGAQLEHVDFTEPFSEPLRRQLIAAARGQGAAVFERGVYAVAQGPRLETAAEINRMAADGCDVVGMTAMPEAGLARELQMDYATLCLVVNPAAGRGEGAITMAAIEGVIDTGMAVVRRVLETAVSQVSAR